MRARATLAFVVRFGDGAAKPLLSYVNPPSAQRIVAHWEELWEATESPDPADFLRISRLDWEELWEATECPEDLPK